MPDLPPEAESAGASALRPLRALSLGMVLVGLGVALDGIGGFFGGWRLRGSETFDHGLTVDALVTPIAALEGILGASLIGKWLAAAGLLHWAPPDRNAWSRGALAVGLVGFGLAEFGLLTAWGIAPGDALAELALPSVLAFLLWRLRPPTSSSPGPEPRPLAWRGLEAFAWANVALGLCLSLVVFATPFAIYRDAMADAWFSGALPADFEPWLRYGFTSIGAAFAAHFYLLARAVRHGVGQRWVWRLYAGSTAAWFLVDSSLSFVHDAAFNVWLVNLPAMSFIVVLLAAARRHVD